WDYYPPWWHPWHCYHWHTWSGYQQGFYYDRWYEPTTVVYVEHAHAIYAPRRVHSPTVVQRVQREREIAPRPKNAPERMQRQPSNDVQRKDALKRQPGNDVQRKEPRKPEEQRVAPRERQAPRDVRPTPPRKEAPVRREPPHRQEPAPRMNPQRERSM